MGIFERYLSCWISVAILIGILLGMAVPELLAQIANLELAGVNFIIALLIWIMIFPMMLQIDFSSIKHVGKRPKGLLLTIVVNWCVKPFTMALVGWFFMKIVFSSWIDPGEAEEYIAGMILLGVAPCTAMVFIWSQLTKGDPSYTLVQVSVNDIIMVFAYAPIAGLLLGTTSITVPWDTLAISVLIYVVLPLIAGVIVRAWILRSRNTSLLDNTIRALKPWSMGALIGTVVLLFAFQSQTIISKPLIIILIAIPLILQTYFIFFLTFYLAQKLKLSHDIAAPACMIGTSNFFELAVAVAIALFGLHSGAALATVVGVLVEVPIMLSLVKICNHYRYKFEYS